MRFKYYLRGCGFGIILAVIVLAVGYHRQNKTMSDAEIMQRAAELGMVLPENGTETLPEAEDGGAATEALAAVRAADSQAEPDGSQRDEEKQGTESSDKKDPGKKNSDRKDSSENAGSAAEEPETVTIEIRQGEVCREIAEDLYGHGLVADAEEFRLFMRDNGYDDLIQTGTYTLTTGMEYKEIAEMITKKEE